MKLSKLNGIAHDALHLGEAFNPVFMLHITLPYEIHIDLMTGKFTPELDKNDSIRRHYEGTVNWFSHILQEEGIPLEKIQEAKIIIEKNTDCKCVIKADEKIFGSSICRTD